jgi:ribosomal protein S18 acetylase RimI-like enzyme
MQIKIFGPQEADEEKEIISSFLYKNLEHYGDPIDDIQNCIEYVKNKGGIILKAEEAGEVLGAVVINATGMSGYIPENILVYIAVSPKARGKGVGKQLMQTAIEKTDGDIALHVEKNNPARFLYENIGFTTPYLEMRYKRK